MRKDDMKNLLRTRNHYTISLGHERVGRRMKKIILVNMKSKGNKEERYKTKVIVWEI